VTKFVVETPHGPARVHLHEADGPCAALVLGHGAGGGVTAPDLVAVKDVALEESFSVTLVEQPYHVAGRRSPAPAHQLDNAWTSVLERLRGDELAGLRFLTGGRSAGARVACRTAQATGAVGVLCLAFPLHPPGRPLLSRLGELDAVRAPVLVVQGSSDPFGMPPPGPNREVVAVRGNHSLRSDVQALRTAVREWLRKQGAA
jgi:uncharacterized protein